MTVSAEVLNPTKLLFTIIDAKRRFEQDFNIRPSTCRMGKKVAKWARRYYNRGPGKAYGTKTRTMDCGSVYGMEIKTDLRLKPCEVVVTDER